MKPSASRFTTPLTLLFSCSLALFLSSFYGCSRTGLTPQQFARVYAREQLINAQYKERSDSARAYVAALYKDAKVNPEQVKAFYDQYQKSPETWADVEALVVKELEALNPRKAVEAKKSSPADTGQGGVRSR